MLSNELHLVVLEHCLKGVALTQANWWVQKTIFQLKDLSASDRAALVTCSVMLLSGR